MDPTRLLLNFRFYSPSLHQVFKDYKHSLISAHIGKLQLKFLKDCFDEKVLPRSLLPLRYHHLNNHPFDVMEQEILKRAIRETSRDVKQRFHHAEIMKKVFLERIPSDWKNTLLDNIFDILRRRCLEKKNRLCHKLKVLFENSDWFKRSNPANVNNLSSKNLDNITIRALGYGFSFNPDNKKPDVLTISKSLLGLKKISDLPPSHIDIAKGVIFNSIFQRSENNFPKCFTKSLISLKRDKEIVITKADKTNSIVILDRVTYSEKISNLLNDTDTYSCVAKDPLNDINKAFNRSLEKILKNYGDLYKRFKSINCTLPYMYGLIKTHKPGHPMRPIVSSVGSIQYKLSKWLVKILSPLIGTISSSNIRNNTDLIEKLQSVSLPPDCKLVSFDVCSLFTKVPVDDVLSFLSEELENYSFQIHGDDIIELIKLCVTNCHFVFENNFYLQKFGLAMGNPLSPLLSNLYMEFFESRILKNILNFDLPWFRYVDDILCIWPANQDIDVFLSNLNNLVPSIKFTLESELDNSLPFLDILLIRQGSMLKYKVYRKNTHKNTYVHYFSNHHVNIKTGIFSTMFLRALRVVSPEFMDEEFKYIMNVGEELCYPRHFLENCLVKARKCFYNTSQVDKEKPENVLVLPFHNNFTVLPKILAKLNIKVVFKYLNTYKKFLIRNCPISTSGHVYSIKCRDCSLCYWGETGKTIDFRFKQHKSYIRNGDERKAVFQHVSNHDHVLDWNQSGSVLHATDWYTRNIVESALISSFPNFNIAPGLYNLDPISIDLIIKSCRNSIEPWIK